MSWGKIYDTTWWGLIGASNGWGNVYPVSGGTSTLLTGLSHLWSFNESSGDAIDQVSSGDISFSSSVIQGSPSSIIGSQVIIDNASTTGQFTCEASSGSYTLFAWLKTSATGTLDYIFDFQGSDRVIFAFNGSSSGQLAFNDGSWSNLGSNASYTDGYYHLFVLTMDADEGEIKMYVDNVQFGATDTGYSSRDISGTSYIASGLKGAYAQAGIYDRVLTTDELTELYGGGFGIEYPFSSANSALDIKENLIVAYDFDEASGNIIDKTGNQDGIPSGILYGETGILGDCIYADGANDNINLTGLTANKGDFSIEYWLKTSETGTNHYLLDVQTGRFATAFAQFGNSKWGLLDSSWHDLGTNSSNDNNWHHIVFIYNAGGDLARLFVDGVNISTATGLGTIPAIGGNIYLMSNFSNSGSFTEGYLNVFRLWERTLSESDIASLYNSGSGKLYANL
ncbi:MAG: LamG-like jellyroll fold domain-containing protein [Cyclobacteriaceae bacterium]